MFQHGIRAHGITLRISLGSYLRALIVFTIESYSIRSNLEELLQVPFILREIHLLSLEVRD